MRPLLILLFAEKKSKKYTLHDRSWANNRKSMRYLRRMEKDVNTSANGQAKKQKIKDQEREKRRMKKSAAIKETKATITGNSISKSKGS